MKTLLLSLLLASSTAMAGPLNRTQKLCDKAFDVDLNNGVTETKPLRFWGPVDSTFLIPDAESMQGYEYAADNGFPRYGVVATPKVIMHIVDRRWLEDPKKYARVGERAYNRLVRRFGEPVETEVAFIWDTKFGNIVLGSARYFGDEGIAIALVCE